MDDSDLFVLPEVRVLTEGGVESIVRLVRAWLEKPGARQEEWGENVEAPVARMAATVRVDELLAVRRRRLSQKATLNESS